MIYSNFKLINHIDDDLYGEILDSELFNNVYNEDFYEKAVKPLIAYGELFDSLQQNILDGEIVGLTEE